ncbi:MAG TPA: L,D-transpeptidase family protein [Vicinamibacterales bacterium]
MTERAWFRAVAACALAATIGGGVAASTAKEKRPNAKRPPLHLACGDLLGFQVFLDRAAFSPGEIDAKAGANLRRALTAFQESHGLAVTGEPDCQTWHALRSGAASQTQGEAAAPQATVTYDVTADDVKGPFVEKIPPKLDEQRELPSLAYRSPLERLSERFHAAPALLRELNHGATFNAGTRITVPAVEPFDAMTKPASDADAGDINIAVSREESAMRATRSDGSLVFFAPVSSGSVHDPLPIGDWKVTSVSWRPVFHYNPDLFWDAAPTAKAAPIQAGPNNPVGVVWIGINLEHYGLHGTPEPSRIGASQSHGCVRLTNWDAARLASLVKPGTPVAFR